MSTAEPKAYHPLVDEKIVNRYLIATHKRPDGYEKYTRLYNERGLSGCKGKVHLHLCGLWWTIITPENLRSIYKNWACAGVHFIVTLGV